MGLSGIDLDLLVALDASLARLRKHFDEPLLVCEGCGSQSRPGRRVAGRACPRSGF
ncbi:hypothetical protein ABT279_24860 [Amycolatopsis sp. NPDC000673]|uniref:Uncharacterized protein n=1 Tax=Amycolatopsis albidoflavus TaxID=102226 RepID=A0ABW5HX77_9PSEU